MKLQLARLYCHIFGHKYPERGLLKAYCDRCIEPMYGNK